MRKKFSTLRRCVFALVFVLAIAGTLVLALTNNGSDDVFYEITITRGHTLEGVLPVAPHIDGYIFMYWSTTPQGGPANINMPLNYDTSLYAVWRIQDDPVGGIEEFAYGGHLNDQTWEEYQQEHYYGHAVARYTHYDSNDYYHYTAGDGYDYYYDPAPTRMYAYGYEHGYSYYHHDLSDSLDHEYNYYTNYHYDYNNTWDETIVIRFLWNHGRLYEPQYQEPPQTMPGQTTHSGEGILIAACYRANITVYPAMDYMVTLDDAYVHVQLPMYISNVSEIEMSLPDGWTYSFGYVLEEIDIDALYLDEEEKHQLLHDLAAQSEDGELRLYHRYTVVTILHDILDRPAIQGITPLASNLPLNFTLVTLQPNPSTLLIDNQSWINAFNANLNPGNLVIAVPQDVTLSGNIAISGNRDIIITSLGTDLQGSTYDHARVAAPYVIRHGGTSGRHFTLSNNVRVHLSHIVICGDVIPPATTSRGGISVVATARLYMRQGSVIRNNRASTGGGIITAGTGTVTMSHNATIINNIATSSGGGIQLVGNTLNMQTSQLIMDGGSIIGNSVTANAVLNGGAGVFAGDRGSITINSGATISNNTSQAAGGGIRLNGTGSQLTMNGGTITDNTANSMGAANGGGGIFITSSANIQVNLNSGTISGNHSATSGGGIFTQRGSNWSPLPDGAFHQLTVLPGFVFANNTATDGGFTPPPNAVAATNIANTVSSGGFTHALNNLDINFWFVHSDWARLNEIINNMDVPTVVIHPSSASGSVTPGIVGVGASAVYNLIISDPGDGSTITTVRLLGGGAIIQPIQAHAIIVRDNRDITLTAASGAHIRLAMPVPNAPAPLNVAPWHSAQATLSRHFNIHTGGRLTLRGMDNTSTLTIYGNATSTTGARGGVELNNEGSTITFAPGGIARNNRAGNGGAVNVPSSSPIVAGAGGGGSIGNPTVIRINGGQVIHNFASTGGGVHLDGLGRRTHFYMTAGSISYNVANGAGGGIGMCCDVRAFIDGEIEISNNRAFDGGGFHLGSGVSSPYNHLFMHGGSLHNNIATNNGGGIHTGNHVAHRTTFTGGRIYNNRAVSINPLMGNGGGVFHDAGRFALLGGEVINNHASGHGGGIHSADRSFPSAIGEFVMYTNRPTMRSHTGGVTANPNYPNGFLQINGNRARLDGGGVNLMAAGLLTTYNTHFMICYRTEVSYNTAGRFGGGIAINNPVRRVYMQGGKLNNNGHGTCVQTGAPVMVYTNTGGTIADPILVPIPINTMNGGGIHVLGGRFTFFHGEVNGNAAMGTGLDDGTGFGGGMHVGDPDSEIFMADYTPGVNTPPFVNAINVNNNSARVGGGLHYFHGIWVYGANGYYATNSGPINFIGNSASERGGAVAVTNDPANPPDNHFLTINYLWTVSGNTATYYGGGIYLHNSTLYMHGGLIGGATRALGNTARYGGGVAVVNGSQFTLEADAEDNVGTIRNNQATGGLNVTTIVFRSNRGGGVYVAGANSNFNMSAGYIRDNQAFSGGGVMIFGFIDDNDDEEHATFSMTGGTISHNSGTGGANSGAPYVISGGGVNVSGDYGRFNLHYGHIHDNVTSQWSGAGVTAMAGAEFTMYDGHIFDNEAAGGAGGAGDSGGGGVAVRHEAIFTMYGGIINNNNGIIGGGVLSYNRGSFIFEDGLVTSNTLDSPIAGILGGGGIAAIANAQIEMRGGTVTNHHLLGTQVGGGAWVGEMLGAPPAHLPGPSSLLMTGGYITNNSANNGGGVHVRGGHEHCPDCGNRLVDCTCPSSLQDAITQSAWLESVSYVSAANAGIQPLSGIAHGTFTLEDGEITNNSARFGGGGVHATENGVFNMHGGIIGAATPQGNSALNGGGVHLSGSATGLMTGGVIRRNRATVAGAVGPTNTTGTGGGVYLTGADTTFTVNGGQIYENIANTVTQGRGGGGLEATANATFTLNQTNDAIPAVILHNYARNSGGGVNMLGGATMHMHNGRIQRNGTTNTGEHGNGGGVAINAGSTIHFHGGIIEDNVGRIGGGLFLYGGTAYMHPGAIIRGNASTHPGGGVAIYSGAATPTNVAYMRMYGGLILSNGQQHHPIASINPQGVPVPNAPGAGTLANTPRGGGVVTGRFLGTFEMRGGTISTNRATYGGGIAMILGSNVLINPMGGGTPLIYNNTATNDGGGVHISGYENRGDVLAASHTASFLVMNGGTIDNNTATRNGGGIFIAGDTVTVSGAINRNRATLNSGSMIVGNTANATGSGAVNGGGGGIYVSSSGWLTATSATITGNNAPNGMGGGIFAERLEYRSPISRYPGAVSVLPDNVAYSNLTLSGVTFGNNGASALHTPPINATVVLPAATFTGTTSQAAPPPLVRIHPLNNYDINFLMPTVPFRFHKTTPGVYNATINTVNDLIPYLLPDAYFSLYYFTGTGTVPDVAHVPSTAWVRVAEGIPSSGLINTPIVFNLTESGIYHLVEIMAPDGFMTPLAQWRIVVDQTAPGGMVITEIGGPLPSFDRVGNYFFVSNIPQFGLPMAGGRGSQSSLMFGFGSGIIVLGAALAALIVVRKKLKQ